MGKLSTTEECPVEITGLWSPGCGKKLVWNYGMLRSVISVGYPDGHRLLDCFVRTTEPHLYPELVDYVLNEQSLYFENIGMRIDKGSNKIILIDNVNKETAWIRKDIFLKFIADLGQDFSKSPFALSMKDSISDSLREMVAKVDNFLKVGIC